MKRYLMCSCGKDSMASLVLCWLNNIHLDGVVIALVMFSHKKKIYADHPIHIDWLFNYAIPFIENTMGYKVIQLKSDKDYVTYFHERIKYSNYPERIGKKHGFCLGGKMCAIKRDMKIRVIEEWCSQQGEFEKILGIATNEPERLIALHNQPNAKSVLEEYNYNEYMCVNLTKKYGLYSPYYEYAKKFRKNKNIRQGCWFCPNASIDEFVDTAENYPHLWNELETLSKVEDTVSPFFKYTRTFESVNAEVQRKIYSNQNQIKLPI